MLNQVQHDRVHEAVTLNLFQGPYQVGVLQGYTEKEKGPGIPGPSFCLLAARLRR